MAENIISSFLAHSALVIKDVESGDVQAKGLKVGRVHIKLISSAMRHMKEDGSTIVDSRIIQASTVTIEAFCPDSATLKQVNNLLMDRANFYSVSSKGFILNNMMVEADQVSQTAEMISAVPIRIAFKQVVSKNIQAIIVAQSADSTLVDRGRSLLSSAAQTVNDLYSKINSVF
jgi:hypothetical protein